MSKELILLADVADLGSVGDVVKVSDGYARNYLLPHKLAAAANKGILRQVEARKLKLQAERAARIEVAKSMAAKIEALTLTIPMAVGDNDKLFGSVSAQMLADQLKANEIELDKNAILLDDGIRELGDFTIEVKLHADVKANLKLKVVKKDA